DVCSSDLRTPGGIGKRRGAASRRFPYEECVVEGDARQVHTSHQLVAERNVLQLPGGHHAVVEPPAFLHIQREPGALGTDERRVKAHAKGERLGAGVVHLDILVERDRKSTRLNSSHVKSSYAVFCLKKKKRDE